MKPLMVCKCLIDSPLVVVSKDNGQRIARIDHEMRRHPDRFALFVIDLSFIPP
jgi:predicted AAA+ superfamily ATPase